MTTESARMVHRVEIRQGPKYDQMIKYPQILTAQKLAVKCVVRLSWKAPVPIKICLN